MEQIINMLNPLINEDDKEKCFEWWHDKRKLTIFVRKGKVSFLKSESPTIQDMEQGDLNNVYAFFSLFYWLYDL